MIPPRCHSCGQSLDDGSLLATITFHGFERSKLNGLATRAHARCVRFAQLPEAEPLPERVSDPTAEPDLVVVETCEFGYTATCRECGEVAVKGEPDDAHLAAARHIARVHSGLVPV